MRRLVALIALLCSLPVGTEGFESFGVPLVLQGSIPGDIAGVPVFFEWNKATSPPTINYIRPIDLDRSPVIFSSTGSTDEVGASAAAFIDAHPEWFRVSSRSFDLRPIDRSPGWLVGGNQFHGEAKILGAFIKFFTMSDGGLLDIDIEARLFPEAALAGLSTETTVSGERALEIALASGDDLVTKHFSTPRKVVAFRGTTPFMAWQIELSDRRQGLWLFLIDGTSGEILAVIDEVDSDGEVRVFIRGDANGDRAIDLSDSVGVLSALFLGGALDCPDAADLNDDGKLDISDALYGLSYLFLDGEPPAKPFPNPGPDLTPDRFVCAPERASR